MTVLVWIEIAVPIGVFLCCVGGCIYVYFRVFLIDRSGTMKNLVPLRYLPDILIPRDEIEDFDRRRTRREQRILKQRLAVEAIQTHIKEKMRNKESREEARKLLAEKNERRKHRKTKNEATMLSTFTQSIKRTTAIFGSSAKISSETSPSPNEPSSEANESFFSRMSKSFKSRSPFPTYSDNNDISDFGVTVDENIEDNDDEDLEMGENSGMNSPMARQSSSGLEHSGSERSMSFTSVSASGKKRFVSKDRLSRASSRKTLIQEIAARKRVVKVEEVITDEAVLREKARVAAMAELAKMRLEARKAKKQQLREDGVVDVVAINSGPGLDQVPKGYKLNETVPQLTPEELTGKRVMYLWDKTLSIDDNPRGLVGWYIGSIAGPSRMKGCNFNIKYDRAETLSIFVDGIKNVNLTLSGNNAYGRRWVILYRDESYVVAQHAGPGAAPASLIK